jgi:hypothetical protein
MYKTDQRTDVEVSTSASLSNQVRFESDFLKTLPYFILTVSQSSKIRMENITIKSVTLTDIDHMAAISRQTFSETFFGRETPRRI